MAAKHTGLGKGLGELFQSTTEPLQATSRREDAPVAMPDNSRLAEVPVDSISPNPTQPRTVFDPEQIEELAESIKEVGLLQPIVVRPLGQDKYELVMGERRLRAVKEAGLDVIPAIIRPTEEADLLRDALLENLHRVQLNPLEEAAAYQQLLSDFGCTQEELATRIKRSRPQISNTLRLLNLPTSVQKRVAAGVLSAGHARALLGLDSPADMEKLATRIVAEGLSVRATEETVSLGERAEKAALSTPSRIAADDPHAATVAALLSDRLETRVRVEMGRAKGKIIVEFAGKDDLDRIVEILAQ
ncbi:MAG: ParB/RepB/Spo0J family partition protein [Propionibacteriaceae bacterium]|jgi:ParB family chromosome partitioning protein|nr:ParB/RepB/Spo0J family partition protein [Propionibacteriaceae bacterium]